MLNLFAVSQDRFRFQCYGRNGRICTFAESVGRV